MGKLRHRGAVTCSRLRSLADVIVESRSRLVLRAWSEIGPSPLCPLPSQLVPWSESYLDFLGDSEDSSPESQVPLPGVDSGLEGRGQRGNETRAGSSGGPWFSTGHGGRKRSPQSLQTGPGLVRCSLLWGTPKEAEGGGVLCGKKANIPERVETS